VPEQPGKNAIEVRGVRKVFGTGENQVAALDTVSVSIRENEFFTLLGPSGCGKTTLLRLIAGFDFPTAGEILLHGQDIAPLPPFKRPVNTVFQSYALFPHMTVAENIGFGLEMLGKPKAEIKARVGEMLKLVKMEALAGAAIERVLAVEAHLALIGPVEAGNDAQQTCLAGARRTKQCDELAGLDLEVDAVQRREVTETLDNVLHFNRHVALAFQPDDLRAAFSEPA
jgi:ABC-type glutathione transport system ATPase component